MIIHDETLFIIEKDSDAIEMLKQGVAEGDSTVIPSNYKEANETTNMKVQGRDVILRVYYEHQSDPNVKNTYVDFPLLPSQRKVTKVELRKIIPEHTELLKDITESVNRI